MVGRSEAMRRIFQLIEMAAPTKCRVLIAGESGTGKELIARAIHAQSPRRDRPFVEMNCGAIPSELIESEMFGHVKGAFTGAIAERKGRFETASSGTLFLDEIGDMTPMTQTKLLRVLQEGVVTPVGSSENKTVDARIVCATSPFPEIALRRFGRISTTASTSSRRRTTREARGHPDGGALLREWAKPALPRASISCADAMAGMCELGPRTPRRRLMVPASHGYLPSDALRQGQAHRAQARAVNVSTSCIFSNQSLDGRRGIWDRRRTLSR
jgi:hypothetical protein